MQTFTITIKSDQPLADMAVINAGQDVFEELGEDTFVAIELDGTEIAGFGRNRA